MNWTVFLPYLLVMAGVTYLIRMLPLTLFRKQIRSRFIRSFLYYIPYAVLTAMTVPGILYSTGFGSTYPEGLWTALAGTAAAVILGWRSKSLLTVAIGACLAAAAAQGLFLLIR